MNSFLINNFSGGIADSSYAGIVGSFASGSRCLDIHSTPNLIKANWKLVKDSGTTVKDLILWSFQGTDNKTYFFGDSGKCYVLSSGTWTVAKDLESRICGAIEYNDFIYVATSNKLYRVVKSSGTYNLANLTSWQTWTGAEVDNYWHPMLVAPSGSLCIGAGQYISTVDSSSNWNSQALNLPPGWCVRCLGFWSDYLLIGANNSNNINKTGIFRWDGIQDSFFTPYYLNEPNINSMFCDGNLVIVQAGNEGNIYQYSPANEVVLLKKIPGTYNSTALMNCYPSAFTKYRGIYMFGVSNYTGNPCECGVYSWGSPNKNYPYVLNFEYVISEDKTVGLDIGNLLSVGSDLYVSWKDSSTVTMTIANPCEVTWTNHNLLTGSPILFTTTGTLPTGITAGTYYYVRVTGTNTFYLYDTAEHAIAGGSTGRVATSGTQSGVHTGIIYGVDKVSTTQRYNKALYNTLVLGGMKPRKVWRKVTINYEPLPYGCSIVCRYKTNRNSTWIPFTKPNMEAVEAGSTTWTWRETIISETLELQLELKTNGIYTPQINSIEVEFDSGI